MTGEWAQCSDEGDISCIVCVVEGMAQGKSPSPWCVACWDESDSGFGEDGYPDLCAENDCLSCRWYGDTGDGMV